MHRGARLVQRVFPPAYSPPRPAGNAAKSGTQHPDRRRSGTGHITHEQAGTAGREPLAAGQHAALRAAFTRLPPCCQHLIALLLEDPPAPYSQISARLGIPVGSIEPGRSRCLDKLRRDPAIAALINAVA